MDRRKIVGAVLLAMGMVGSASAANGFYAGVSVGEASIDACDDVVGATSCDDSDTSWKIFGGYDLNEYFAVEAAWVDMGEISASGPGVSVTAEGDGFVADVKGTLPINDQFGVFAKVGLISWELEGGGAASGLEDDGNDAMYGVGAHYMFTEQFGVVAEWERFDTDDEVDMWSVGGVIKF